MAINLGDINFGVGADVSALQRSVQSLQNFSRVVDRANSSVDATAAALRRQENAAGNAFIKVQNLTAAMARVRGSERFIQQTNAAYEQYSRVVTRGALSTLEMQRAQERLKVTLSGIQNQFKAFTSEARRAEAGAGGFIDKLRGLQAAAVFTSGPMGGIATRISAFTAVTKASGFAIAAFVAGAATMTAAIAKLGFEINRVGAQWKGYENGLKAVTGSTEQGAMELQKVIGISRAAGTAIASTVPAFVKFTAAAEGTSLQGAKAEKIFTQFAKASAILNLSADDSAGIFKALEQMISKGTVQAEELRGQLGDRLPGAFQLAARAMGVTTAKLGDMMKKGEVMSTELLPKLADELTRTFNIPVGPVDTYASAMGNLGNAYEQLLIKLDERFDITGKVQAAAEAITSMLDYVRVNLDDIIAKVAIFGSALAVAFGGGIPAIALLAGAIYKFGDEITVVEGKAGSLRDYFAVVYSDIERIASETASRIKESNSGMFDGVADGLSKDISTIQGYFTTIDEMATTAFNGIIAAIMSVVEAAPSIPGAAVAAMATLWNALVSGASAALNTVLGAIATVVNAVQSLGGLLDTAIVVDTSKWKVDLSGFKSEVSNAGAEAGLAFDQAWERNKGKKYFQNANKELTDTTNNYIKSVQRRADVEGQLRENTKNDNIEKQNAWQNVKNQNAELERQARLQENLKRIGADDAGGGGGKGKKKKGGGKGQSPEKQAQAIDNINEAIKRTTQEIDELSDADGNMKLLNEEFKRLDEVKKYGDAMRKAGVDAGFIKDKTGELYELLKQRDALKQSQQGWQEWTEALSGSVDFFGESLVDLAFEGKDAFKNIGEAAKNLAKDLVNTFIQLSLTNPLKNLIFEQNNPTMPGGGSGFGGILGKMFGGLFGGGGASKFVPNTTLGGFLGLRNGGAVEGGFQRIQKAANGMITKPTMFNTPMGTVQGGEAGTEAIMPLEKNSSGSLGIRATLPNTGNVYVNVNVPEGSTVKKKQSQNAQGDQFIDFVVQMAKDGVAADMAAGGTAINKATEGRYGLTGSAGLKKTK